MCLLEELFRKQLRVILTNLQRFLMLSGSHIYFLSFSSTIRLILTKTFLIVEKIGLKINNVFFSNSVVFGKNT